MLLSVHSIYLQLFREAGATHGAEQGETHVPVKEGDRVWVKGWFPVLFELSCIISRCKMDVRTRLVVLTLLVG